MSAVTLGFFSPVSLAPHISLPQRQATVVLDLDGAITRWSLGAEALFGWSAAEAVGKNVSLVFPGQPEVLDDLRRVGDVHELHSERGAQRRDGTQLWVDVHASLMLDERGAVVGVVGILQDATERRRLAVELLRQSELEHHLVAMVSHDLRNPLAAVLLSATLGLQSTQDPKLKRYFDRIKVSAERGARLIHDLLDFNVVRNGGAMHMHPRPADLGRIVREQIDEVLVTRPERQVQLDLDGDLTGVWDPDRIAQVVSNLVTNALQHTTEDVVARVSVKGEPACVALEVHNGGEPVPADMCARLFEPWVHGQVSSRGGRSIGLGLYITQAIVEAHGGAVACRSSAERGTTFTVRLPRAREAKE